MAIYYLQFKMLGRSAKAGARSSVAAAAYRAGAKLHDARTGITHNHTLRPGIVHAEIVLPTGVEAQWAVDRAALWNAVEKAEVRKDARVAREIAIGLPHELNAAQRLAAALELAHDLADQYSAAVDVTLHSPHGKMAETNHTAQLLMTTRMVGPESLTDKTKFEQPTYQLLENNLPTASQQMRDIRKSWALIANAHLKAAGQIVQIDHRSYEDRGIDLLPTRPVGMTATRMRRSGAVGIDRQRLTEEEAAYNAEVIVNAPEQLVTLIAGETPVFDARDIARALHRAIDTKQPTAERYAIALARVMASPELVPVESEDGSKIDQFTTRALQAASAQL
jgi:ATP-dependent exoDNAse (exonuclease V) alpha subunit